MAETVAKYLLWKPDGLYVDATLGLGGHTACLLRSAAGGLKVIGVDRDSVSLELARERLGSFARRVTYVHGNFREIGELIGGRRCDGFLLDCGVSSFQLADTTRGFSYLRDGPLDMAMGDDGRSVRELLANADEKEIGGIIRTFGEERRYRAIARAIVEERTSRPIERSLHLRTVIERAVPARGAIATLSRCFQAFRIWANEELDSLRAFLPQAVELLNRDGRLVVVSYHSLEDREVKQFLKREETGCICPPDFPECRCGQVPRLKILTRRPVRPDANEVERNPRSRSAKLRAAKRV